MQNPLNTKKCVITFIVFAHCIDGVSYRPSCVCISFKRNLVSLLFLLHFLASEGIIVLLYSNAFTHKKMQQK